MRNSNELRIGSQDGRSIYLSKRPSKFLSSLRKQVRKRHSISTTLTGLMMDLKKTPKQECLSKAQTPLAIFLRLK